MQYPRWLHPCLRTPKNRWRLRWQWFAAPSVGCCASVVTLVLHDGGQAERKCDKQCLSEDARKEPEGKNAKGKNFWKLRGRKKMFAEDISEDFSEDRRCGKKRGEENLTNDTPPKRGFGPPSYGTFWERVLWYVVLPPYVFAPAPLTAQVLERCLAHLHGSTLFVLTLPDLVWIRRLAISVRGRWKERRRQSRRPGGSVLIESRRRREWRGFRGGGGWGAGGTKLWHIVKWGFRCFSSRLFFSHAHMVTWNGVVTWMGQNRELRKDKQTVPLWTDLCR